MLRRPVETVLMERYSLQKKLQDESSEFRGEVKGTVL